MKSFIAKFHKLRRQNTKKIEQKLEISGVLKPFSFIHWTDVHLSECDLRDKEIMKKMANRAKRFGDPRRLARQMVLEFNDLKPDLVTITGDFLDAPTQANIEIGAKLLSTLDMPVSIALGNHEWGSSSKPWNREYWWSQLRPLTDQPLDWYVQQLNGVNLLFVDDSNYQITPDQLRKTQELLEDGKSCIIFLHIPVVIDSLIPRTKRKWGTTILLGAEGVATNKRDKWKMGKNNAPSTTEFVKLIKSHPQIKSIFAGHLHFDHEDEYRQGCNQYVTGGGFQKHYRIVRIVPEVKGNNLKA